MLASSNLEDEIHFKCGRFVTSQNSKFWNVILNKYFWLSFDCGVIACVKLSEIWNFLKVECEGMKWLSQTFTLHFDLHEFKLISSQNPRVKKIWLLPFKMKRVFENIWISFANNSNQKLYATQWFSWERIRWLLQNIWNRVGSGLKFKSKTIWELFWFLFKLFLSKNKIYGN